MVDETRMRELELKEERLGKRWDGKKAEVERLHRLYNDGKVSDARVEKAVCELALIQEELDSARAEYRPLLVQWSAERRAARADTVTA